MVSLGNTQIWYHEMESYSNKYLKMWKWLYNGVMGKGRKNFEAFDRIGLDCLEEAEVGPY